MEGLQYKFNIIYRRETDADGTKSFDFTEYVNQLLEVKEMLGKGYYADRDAPIGSNIFDEGFRVIKSSRFTIVILSEEFVKDNWNMYWQLAAFRVLVKKGRDGFRRFLPIALGIDKKTVEEHCTNLCISEVLFVPGDFRRDARWERKLIDVIKNDILVSQLNNHGGPPLRMTRPQHPTDAADVTSGGQSRSREVQPQHPVGEADVTSGSQQRMTRSQLSRAVGPPVNHVRPVRRGEVSFADQQGMGEDYEISGPGSLQITQSTSFDEDGPTVTLVSSPDVQEDGSDYPSDPDPNTSALFWTDRTNTANREQDNPDSSITRVKRVVQTDDQIQQEYDVVSDDDNDDDEGDEEVVEKEESYEIETLNVSCNTSSSAPIVELDHREAGLQDGPQDEADHNASSSVPGVNLGDNSSDPSSSVPVVNLQENSLDPSSSVPVVNLKENCSEAEDDAIQQRPQGTEVAAQPDTVSASATVVVTGTAPTWQRLWPSWQSWKRFIPELAVRSYFAVVKPEAAYFEPNKADSTKKV